MPCQIIARLENLTLVGLIVSGLLSWGSVAHATGRWNLPSSVPQYFGYGNGPGYHAPRVRIPGHTPAKVSRRVKMPANGCPGNCEPLEVVPLGVPTGHMGIRQFDTPTSGPTTFNEQSVKQPPFPQPLDSWLAPVPLPAVAELPSKPVSRALFPPRGPLPEEPAAARIEQPEEMKSELPVPGLKNPLFSAPPLPAYQS
jgi:hypothetical protein